MDILKRLDRQLLKNEIYDVVRFNIDIERGYGYIPNPTKISLLHKEAHILMHYLIFFTGLLDLGDKMAAYSVEGNNYV